MKVTEGKSVHFVMQNGSCRPATIVHVHRGDQKKNPGFSNIDVMQDSSAVRKEPVVGDTEYFSPSLTWSTTGSYSKPKVAVKDPKDPRDPKDIPPVYTVHTWHDTTECPVRPEIDVTPLADNLTKPTTCMVCNKDFPAQDMRKVFYKNGPIKTVCNTDYLPEQQKAEREGNFDHVEPMVQS